MPETSCQYNKIYVIQSLNPDEPQTGKDLVAALEPLVTPLGVPVSFCNVATQTEFLEEMDRIWAECSTVSPRLYPIIHLETHGFGDLSGISIRPPREKITWPEFAEKCRAINAECHNNMMVTTGLCYGLHAITDVNIREAAPFLVLVGPEESVSVSEVRGFVAFYQDMLEHGDLRKAAGFLDEKFGVFLADRLFVNAFAKYLKEDCKGQGRAERIERLLCEFMESKSGHRISEAAARTIIETYTQPNRESFERFKARFLMSDHPRNKGRFDESVRYEDAFELSERGD